MDARRNAKAPTGHVTLQVHGSLQSCGFRDRPQDGRRDGCSPLLSSDGRLTYRPCGNRVRII